MKKYIFIILLILPLTYSFGQPSIGNPLRWERSFGGTSTDIAYSVYQTSDGGYIVAGSTYSNDVDVSVNFGDQDFWVVKLNNFGAKQWEKSFGGSGSDVAKCVMQTGDLGYIVVGYTNSMDGDITQFYGNNDYWAVKLSASGSVQWQQSYGGSDIDEANDVIQTADGGFLIAGRSFSNDNGILDHNGMFDAWIVKTDALGVMQWDRSYGGSLFDEAKSVIQTPDLGYIVACSSNSNDSDVIVNKGGEDYWIIKLSSAGAIQWQKSLGGTSSDIPSKIIKTLDGKIFIQGSTSSNDGDVTGNHLSQDYWGVKINTTGNIIWQRSLGGSNTETGTSVIQTPDSSFVLCGHTQSFDGDVLMNHGMWDSWIVKLDKNGSSIWAKSFGGSNYDYTYAITPGNYASTVIAGSSSSTDGNVSVNHGLDDYWIADVKNLTASFSATNDTLCALQTVGFTNYTSNATTYQWQINNVTFDNQYNTSYTFNTPGSFNITLIASNALSIDSATIEILVHPLPDISLGNDTSICPGFSITLDPGFNIDYSYQWSTNETTPAIDITSSGTYSVTATDVFTGCENADTINVSSGSSVAIDLGSDQTECEGYSVFLSPGFFTGCSYLWSTGETTQSINVTTTDDYSVTVTKNSSGCFDSDTVHVTFNPEPVIDLGPDKDTCTGSIITADAGFFPGATYLWSTGDNTQAIQTSVSGEYWVMVTNTFGCTGKDTVQITFNPVPDVNLGSDFNICSGTSTTLDAGYDSGASYLWSNSETTQIITVTTGGSYSVTVCNSFGCTDADTININVITSPVVNLGNDQTVCSGTPVMLDAQNTGSVYLWSTEETTQTILITTDGEYSVTVTNLTNGCTGSDTVNITFITAPVVDLGSDQSLCSGDTAWLSAPLISGASYSWSTGAVTQTISATTTDTYSVTVTVTGGCSDADTVNVLFNTPPSVDLGSDITSCTGDTVNIGATCAGCSYYWLPGLQNSPDIDVYYTDTYILKITDPNGCANSDTIQIVFNIPPAIVIDSIKNASCHGLPDGAIFTTVMDGTAPFIYQWSDAFPANDDHINIPAGIYSLTVSDNYGCTDTSSFIVDEPELLSIDSVHVTNTSCNNTTDGSITVYASGGTGTLLYSIDNGNTYQSAQQFQNLPQNTYTVTVKDMNGCTAALNNINIISNSNLDVFLGNDTTICNSASITLDAGNPGATFSWNPLGQTSQSISATAGTYSVSVYQAGCTATDTIIISGYSLINVIIDSVSGVSCFGLSDGVIYTTVSGGVSSYSYIWSPNSGTTVGDDYLNLISGTYTVTVTDSTTCTAIQSAFVPSPAALAIITDNVLSTSCSGAANGAIYITAGGGTSPYYFTWSSGQVVEDMVNIPAGNYSVTVTDANICTASETFVVIGPSELIVSVDSITDAIVCGSATGAVYITASGGTFPYTYIWNDNATTEDNINVAPGFYIVTVTDNNGCSADLSATVYDNYCQVYIASGTTTASICDSINYVEIGPMVIMEYADTSSGFIKSQNNVHLILNAPNNFEFEAGVGNLYYGNGNNDITIANINIDPQFIDITFSTANSYSHLDTLAITGIRVKAISSVIFSPNEILMDPSSTAAINGISLNTVFGILHQSTVMTITNITTYHTDSTDIVRGSLANCVAGIKISTSGNCGTPMLVQEFELSTATSDNPYDNIIEARIFYTGHSPYFGAVDIQGTAILPDGDFSIVAATPQALLEGDNYFWLTYDVKDSAFIGDSIEGKCIKAIIDGNYYYATVLPPVSLKRMVNSLGSFISQHSGNWDDAYSWGGKYHDKALWSPDENDDVTINNGDTITLTSNGSCANLTINDGSLILGSYQLTVSGNLTGNEKDSIRSTSSSSLVINDLGGKDQFPIPTAMKKLKKITLNRANGAYCNHDLDLDDAVPTDSIVLVLSNGALVMSSGKKVLMNSKAIQKDITSSNSTYIDGIVSRNIKRDVGFYIYPLGDNGECRPFGVATQSGNGDNISEVQFFWIVPINFAYIDYHFLPGGITDKMYWQHNIISGANTKRRIYYHDEDFPGLSSVERDSALCLANNNGVMASEWTKETTPYDVYDDAGKKYVEFTSANASNDPYWTFGSVYEDDPLVENPLPIELLSFDAALNDELSVDLEWTTASEMNNDYFTVERAGSDMQFIALFTVNGAGNNYSLLAYHAVDDSPLEGTSYYRLKQTDFDGEFTYSSIRTVINDADNPVLVYPNPASNEFIIQMFAQVTDNVTISLFDDKGLKVFEKEVSIQKGTNEITVDIQNLSHAVYMLRIDFENNTIKPYRYKISKI
ncbi:MAG: T9SS type A sorting domain-containing protein [Bacteroidota bacterium]